MSRPYLLHAPAAIQNPLCNGGGGNTRVRARLKVCRVGEEPCVTSSIPRGINLFLGPYVDRTVPTSAYDTTT